MAETNRTIIGTFVALVLVVVVAFAWWWFGRSGGEEVVETVVVSTPVPDPHTDPVIGGAALAEARRYHPVDVGRHRP